MELSFPLALVCTSTWLSLINMMTDVSIELEVLGGKSRGENGDDETVWWFIPECLW
jgi:hypothetical protein